MITRIEDKDYTTKHLSMYSYQFVQEEDRDLAALIEKCWYKKNTSFADPRSCKILATHGLIGVTIIVKNYFKNDRGVCTCTFPDKGPDFVNQKFIKDGGSVNSLNNAFKSIVEVIRETHPVCITCDDFCKWIIDKIFNIDTSKLAKSDRNKLVVSLMKPE